jgi:hypothetical protein
VDVSAGVPIGVGRAEAVGGEGVPSSPEGKRLQAVKLIETRANIANIGRGMRDIISPSFRCGVQDEQHVRQIEVIIAHPGRKSSRPESFR